MNDGDDSEAFKIQSLKQILQADRERMPVNVGHDERLAMSSNPVRDGISFSNLFVIGDGCDTFATPLAKIVCALVVRKESSDAAIHAQDFANTLDNDSDGLLRIG